jgi:heme-binding NEAT domain protein
MLLGMGCWGVVGTFKFWANHALIHMTALSTPKSKQKRRLYFPLQSLSQGQNRHSAVDVPESAKLHNAAITRYFPQSKRRLLQTVRCRRVINNMCKSLSGNLRLLR